MTEIYKHDTLGEITIRSSSRASRVSIGIYPTLEVRVTVPLGVPRSKIIALIESRAEWIVRSRERMAKRKSVTKPLNSPDVEVLRGRAKEYLPGRIREISQMTGLQYSRLTIRAMKSRWGSCSTKGDISLNLYLMALPEHLIDFVIIHELCHTVHHDHSQRFHALVMKHTQGRERALTRELMGYSLR